MPDGSCTPGSTQLEDGSCANPCAEGQEYYDSASFGDMCFDSTCPEGQGHGFGNGQCRECDLIVNGACVFDPDDIPFDHALEECEAGGRVSTEQCNDILRDRCEAGNSQARYCGEVFGPDAPNGPAPPPADDVAPAPDIPPSNRPDPPPAEDEPTPPPAEDGEAPPPADDEAPPPAEGGEAPPPAEDGEAPPPADDEAPPPAEDGEAPPPADDGEAPPPADDEAPPPAEDGEAPPPADDEAPPPADDGEAPPPPADGAPPPSGTPPPAGGTPPSPGGTTPPSGETAPPAPAKKPAPQAAAEGAPGPPLAVVIAIGEYDDKDVDGVPQAIPSAAHIVRFLKGDLGVDDERIITGHNATRGDFVEIFGRAGDTAGELRELLKDEPASEVIVYFAGRAQALDGGEDVLLLPSDADPAKPETGVRLSALYDTLAEMDISKLRLYLDAPFAGGKEVVAVDAGPSIGLWGLFTPPHWVTLSAAKDTSKPGKTDRSRSLFADSLVAGLRGIADTTGDGDGDGTVSAKELYEFTRGQAEAAAKRGAKAPTPSFYGKPGETLRAY